MRIWILVLLTMALSGAATAADDTAFARGDFAGAERDYAATLEKSPNDATALAGLARIRLYQEQRDAARQLAGSALAADPGNALAKRVIAGVTAREASFAPGTLQFQMTELFDVIKFTQSDPLPAICVRVGGKSVYFLIDTGAPDLVLDKDFAAELGLQSVAAGQGTFAGGAQAAIARAVLPKIEVGGVTVSNVPVTLLPTRNFAGKLRIDGIVGTGFLMHFLATLDYKNGALILAPRDNSAAVESTAARNGSTVVPMWLVGDHFIFARGHINAGPEGLFNIDTGLEGAGIQASRMTLDAAGVAIDESKVQTGQGGAGSVRFIPFKAAASLGGLTVADVDGVYTPDGDQYGIFPFAVAGTLSHSFFRGRALTFDFVAMKIVVK